MKHSIFGYFFKNKKVTVAFIIIICYIFGIFFLIGENVNYIIEQIQLEQAMLVYIDIDATSEEQAELEQKIRAIQYVNTIEYVSQEQALNEMKEWLGDAASLLDSYSGDQNPFSAYFIITLTDLTKSEEVESQIETFENVSRIIAGNQKGIQTVNELVNIANGIRIATGIILVLLILMTIFIIVNMIRKRQYNKR